MSRLLWIRSEAFDHGVFNTSVRWTVPKVLDFLGSLRVAVASMSIAQAAWVEAATSRCKPALTESESVAYWHVFSVLQQSILGQQADWLDIRLIGVILMCQVFTPHRVGRDQGVKNQESWPSQERATVSSPRHSPRGSSPRVAVGAAPQISRGRDASAALLNFVRQHLSHFLQVACFALTAEPASVAVEDFDVLRLILCGGSSFSQPLRRISEAVPELCSKKSLPLKDLRKLVEKALVWNDEIYPPAEAGAGAERSHVERPADGGAGPAVTVNVAGMSKTTWFQRPSDGDVDFLNITSCTDCTIYVTSRARFCLLAGCHDCTVIMTGVSALCTMQNCEKTAVHAAAHCFKIENSIDCSAYVYCHLPPILTGDTRGIKLAPYNVLYSQMAAALQSANMTLDPEFVDTWAHPVCCTLGSPDETHGGRSGSMEEQNNSTYHFVHPKTFQPVMIPEPAGSLAAASPRPTLVLPQVYDDALKEKNDEMRALQRQLAEIEDEGRRRRAQQAIQGHFREWLTQTGKSRQLADLGRMGQSGQAL